MAKEKLVGNQCPVCGRHEQHNPISLYIFIGIVVFFLIVVVVVYIKFLLVKEKSNVCMRLRKEEKIQ